MASPRALVVGGGEPNPHPTHTNGTALRPRGMPLGLGGGGVPTLSELVCCRARRGAVDWDGPLWTEPGLLTSETLSSLATPTSRSYIRETPPERTPKRLPGDPEIEVIYSGNASGKHAKTSPRRPRNRGHIFGKRLRKARQNESPATPESRSYIRETPPESTPKRVPGDPRIEVIYSGNASGKDA